ncbi:MAG: 3-phosphoshikimate 1-carboxyvinyltransferase [Verrucomicrobiae bacterium]|nr:3-phosphoshikimate 1-carboxyvinyltransferase [Verrucomicrobiae bacterium]
MPLEPGAEARVTVPGSKSITNRALVLAALARGPVTLRGALWSEDTQLMVEALRALGFKLEVAPEPDEPCNCVIRVQGLGGTIPLGGTAQNPLELYVGNAGTVARFLAAFVCLGHGVYRLHGTARMHERPQAALFNALRQLGYRIDSANDRLPATIYGAGPARRVCTVSIEESSQFASALLLCSSVGGWHINVVGENAEESPYVRMTAELLKLFPWRGGEFQIEPDASSGSYFLALDALLGGATAPAGRVRVVNWPSSDLQVDSKFVKFLPLPQRVSRLTDLGDSIMTAIVLAPFAGRPVEFTDLARLRLQECDRVSALRRELSKCGAVVVERGDTLTVYPSALRGAEIETYEDHRIAMCFSVLGLKVPGIRIKNPACVKKTFPSFYQKLAAAAPGGLGATILDPVTGRRLGPEALFAD